MQRFCYPATSKTITQYNKLAKDPATRDVWQQAFGKEFGRMAQGDNKTIQKGKKCIFVMNHDKIAQMRTKGKKLTYLRVVVDFLPQKSDPNRVIITAGGNISKYAWKLTTRTAELTTANMLWNSVISTEGEIFEGLYLSDLYLETPMDEYAYMTMPLLSFPQHTVKQYQLNKNAQNGKVYLEIWRAIYRLPQAGAITNTQLNKFLALEGY